VSAQLAPDYTGIELGIGESLLVKAISESSGRSAAKVKSDLKKEGDLGLVAMVCDKSNVHKPK
jgi:DNA ligase 1